MNGWPPARPESLSNRRLLLRRSEIEYHKDLHWCAVLSAGFTRWWPQVNKRDQRLVDGKDAQNGRAEDAQPMDHAYEFKQGEYARTARVFASGTGLPQASPRLRPGLSTLLIGIYQASPRPSPRLSLSWPPSWQVNNQFFANHSFLLTPSFQGTF